MQGALEGGATVKAAKTVRVTLRLQWDQTISALELHVPVEEFQVSAPDTLARTYGGALFYKAVQAMRDRSVERMFEGNGFESRESREQGRR